MTDKLHLNRLMTGVPGLDTVLGGGLPELSFNIIGGAPGSGKTTFAQQIMFALASPNRKALFFTALGEPPVKMLRYQQQFSFFNLDLVDNGIKFISLATEVQQGDYQTVLSQIKREVETYAPAYVFIDSFRSFITGAKGDNQETYMLQTFIQQLVMHMTSWQATTFLIGEYQMNETDKNPIFTVADGIIWLHQNMHGNSLVRKLQVIKMRGQEQRAGLHTMRIGPHGIDIFPRTIAAAEPSGADGAPMQQGRVSTGIPELNAMLGGGLPASYSMLLVGPSGCGKTVIATEFLAEAARQGEPAVIAVFEKSPSQMINDKLDQLVRSGKVGMLNLRSLDLSTDEAMQALLNMIDAMGAKRVVIDSLSGFELTLAPEFRADFRESLYRMVTVLNARGITLLMTTELEDRYSELRFSPYGSAFLVDAIVMQRYVEVAGQIQTVIAVVKVRGSGHSRDMRAFSISADGVTIGTSPLPFEGVLAGSRRPIA